MDYLKILFVPEKIVGHQFLADTGAEVSVLPPSLADRRARRGVSALQAANGSRITTYPLRSPTLNIGHRRESSWLFVLADVEHPIRG